MSDAYARNLFRIAAGFNLAAGLPLLVALRPVAALLQLELTPTATVFIQITMGVVVLFGWAYWMVASDPERYRPYILLGLLGKILVISVAGGHWLAGDLAWPLPALASGDIVFSALFARYLMSTQR